MRRLGGRAILLAIAVLLAGGGPASADIGNTAHDESASIAARPLLRHAVKTANAEGGYSYVTSYRGNPVELHYELGIKRKYVGFEFVIYRGKTAAIKLAPSDAGGKAMLAALLSQSVSADFEAAHLIVAVTNLAGRTSSEIYRGQKFGYAVNHTAGYADGNAELDVIEKKSIPIALATVESCSKTGCVR